MYSRTTWLARLRQYTNRIKLTLVGGTTDQFDVEQIEGTVSQAGVAMSPAHLNNIEDGINECIDQLVIMLSIEGFSTGLQVDAAGYLRLWKNPTQIYNYVTANQVYTEVYNTSFDIDLSGGYINRYSRALFLRIVNTDTAYEQVTAIINLGAATAAYITDLRSVGDYKTLKITTSLAVLVNFSTAHQIGGNVLVSGGVAAGNQFAWGTSWSDTTKKLSICIAGTGGFGTSHTVKFTAEAFFI